jgi:hypothetical protein
MDFIYLVFIIQSLLSYNVVSHLSGVITVLDIGPKVHAFKPG